MGKRIANFHGIEIDYQKLFLCCICAMPILTATADISMLNRAVFGVLSLLQMCLILRCKLRVNSVMHISILIVLYVYTLFQTDFPIGNTNLLFYYPFTVIYTLFVIDNHELMVDIIRRSEALIRYTALIWTILVGISMFLPSSYYVKEGGRLYFGSFANDIFRLGPTAVFVQILALILMGLFGYRNAILYMIVPIYCYFMGSSRTYLIVGIFLFMIGWYWYGARKKTFVITTVALLVFGFYVFSMSAIADKMAYVLDDSQYGDFWFRLTSSRNVIWKVNILAWMKEPLLNKLFGCGIDFSLKNYFVWSHNDFVELLGSFGACGAIQYLMIMSKLFCIMRTGGEARVPWWIRMCVIAAWFFNACLNMHYTYFCCLLSLPLLVIAMNETYQYGGKTELW